MRFLLFFVVSSLHILSLEAIRWQKLEEVRAPKENSHGIARTVLSIPYAGPATRSFVPEPSLSEIPRQYLTTPSLVLHELTSSPSYSPDASLADSTDLKMEDFIAVVIFILVYVITVGVVVGHLNGKGCCPCRRRPSSVAPISENDTLPVVVAPAPPPTLTSQLTGIQFYAWSMPL